MALFRRCFTWIPVAAAFAAGSPASPALRWAGYLRAAGHDRFFLTDVASGQSSGWLEVGAEWHGWHLAEFDPKRQVLRVTQGSGSAELPLQDGVVHAGALTKPAGRLEPKLLRGTFTESGGVVTYSPDAIVECGPFRVSAFNGQLQLINGELCGDLATERGNQIIDAAGGRVVMRNGQPLLLGAKGKSLRVQMKPGVLK